MENGMKVLTREFVLAELKFWQDKLDKLPKDVDQYVSEEACFIELKISECLRWLNKF
jgi:hypothetical protein